jgi:DNA (cytosine-5)-methyltransferase 1
VAQRGGFSVKYLSVCSGIEAASVAWHPLGWEPVAFSEIEPFPSAVLAHHYPTVPNLGDMTKFQEWPDEPVELLVGGTPCQSFSVAGLRKGLEDPRGNLMLTYLAIAQRYRPRWLVWENVPGVLSSNGGRDFGTFLGALGELGYGWAYRVLDAQWFGVAQRRRRVFVVGYLGDWQRAAKVLFERESVRRDTPPSREARQGAAASVGGGPHGGRIAGTVSSKWSKGSSGPAGDECYNMVAQPVAFHNRQDPDVSGDITHPLGAKDNGMAVAFHENQRGELTVNDTAGALKVGGGKPGQGYPAVAVAQPITQFGNIAGSLTARHDSSPCADRGQNVVAQPVAFVDVGATLKGGSGSRGYPDPSDGNGHNMVAQPVATDIKQVQWASGGGQLENDTAQALRSNAEHNYQFARIAMQVRRLTPVECERLQGFPDGYTNIPWRKKPEAPDGPRYKALGNSMAVPCMAWIGQRIAEVDRGD